MQVSNPIRELALVTGASSGIGFELATVLAQKGYDLIVTAEDAKIEECASRLQQHGIEAYPFRANLIRTEELHNLLMYIGELGRPLAVAAINAGVGRGGKFMENQLDDEMEVINLNVVSTFHLAKHIVTGMKNDGRGGKILFTASIAATMPGTYSAVYNASKSFVLSLSEALHLELKEYGITVTALMPGPTETNFFHRADMDATKVGVSEKDDPADVARQGIEALMDGKDHVVAGSFKTKMTGLSNEILPEQLKAKMHADMAKPGSAAANS